MRLVTPGGTGRFRERAFPMVALQGSGPDGDKEACVPMGLELDWLDKMLSGLHVGSTTLLAGIPSGGKTRIANQIMLGAATMGVRSVCLMTEERVERLDRRLTLMTSDWPRRKA